MIYNHTLPLCPLYVRDTGLIWKSTHGIITFEYVAYFVITPVQAILGIVGNGIAFFVAIHLADHVTNHYLSHLAVSNTIVCALALIYPFTEQLGAVRRLTFIQSCPWIIMVRKVFLIISATFKKASILIITIFFLDRYIVVSRPTQLNTWRQSRIHTFLPMIVVLVAFLFTIPTLKWYTINRCRTTSILPTNYTSSYGHHSHNEKVYYSFLRNSDSSNHHKVWCFKDITGRGNSFVIYEMCRELILTILPSITMMYFVIVIAYTILNLKKKSRKKQIETSMVQQVNNECNEPSTIEVGMRPLNNASGINLVRQARGTNLELTGTFNTNDEADNLGHVLPKSKPPLCDRNFNSLNTKMDSGWRIVIILCGFVILYCLSTVPASIMSLLYSLSYSIKDTPSLDNMRELWANIITLSVVLDLANYCWCFYMYTILDTTFRQRLMKILHLTSRRRINVTRQTQI